MQNVENNLTESLVTKINSNVFFREFTFCKTDFQDVEKRHLEFADNVVWLDNLLFIYQIKDRNIRNETGDVVKWYKNKVINKGKQQIKSTLRYLENYQSIIISNVKGHKLDIKKSQRCPNKKKIIIYTPNGNFPDEIRFQHFYESSEVGLIHLFHSEDYLEICGYLRTPAEINDYLDFREDFYLYSPIRANKLPEQYLLGHFMEGMPLEDYNPECVLNLRENKNSIDKFDISPMLLNFNESMILCDKSQTTYYPVIREIAKLNRGELHEFKKRFIRMMEISETKEIEIPYRMHSLINDCSFIFIPLHSKNAMHWKTALQNYTMIMKYSMQAMKCLGVVLFRSCNNKHDFEIYWEYLESPWQYDSELEQLLENSPLRKVKAVKLGNLYKQK